MFPIDGQPPARHYGRVSSAGKKLVSRLQISDDAIVNDTDLGQGTRGVLCRRQWGHGPQHSSRPHTLQGPRWAWDPHHQMASHWPVASFRLRVLSSLNKTSLEASTPSILHLSESRGAIAKNRPRSLFFPPGYLSHLFGRVRRGN
jgi:hypothetical protein